MKRLIVLFIALILVGGVAFPQKREVGKVKTIVIDPGHGGDKPGAIGKRSMEKDLVLAVATKFGRLISDNFSDVKVIYTRTTDVDISLAERAHIANRNKADLFVSVHANSHPTQQPTGVETFVMGLSQSRANMEVAKKENADILLEAGYKNNAEYQGFDPNSPESYVMFAMYQNAYLDKSLDFAQYVQDEYKRNLHTIDRGVKQAELFVIYKTAMPAVLTEIGFISNLEEEAFMMSPEGQAKIAVSLFNAFCNYKAHVEGTKRLENPVINLPGYTSTDAASSKSEVRQPVVHKLEVPDSVLEARRMSSAVASTIAASKGESVPQVHPVESEQQESPVVKKFDPNQQAPAKQPVAEQPVSHPVAQPVASEQPKQEPAPAQPVATTRVSKPESTPVTQPVVKSTPQSSSKSVTQPVDREEVRYRVQFLTSTRALDENDYDLRGVKDFKVYQQNGTYRYTVGDEGTIGRATVLQKTMREKGFKDAFVIAWYKGKRISLQEAKEIRESQGE
ncbi:MAG: N-acetylmuramoyl-L-alanine amidase [Bacteroidales bacterium]|nr:N-acetylmuramoyl-L-alanine amidase [Bacteroidales bacterium]